MQAEIWGVSFLDRSFLLKHKLLEAKILSSTYFAPSSHLSAAWNMTGRNKGMAEMRPEKKAQTLSQRTLYTILVFWIPSNFTHGYWVLPISHHCCYLVFVNLVGAYFSMRMCKAETITSYSYLDCSQRAGISRRWVAKLQ